MPPFDAAPLVLDANDQFRPVCHRLDPHQLTRIAVLDGVVEEIHHGLFEKMGVHRRDQVVLTLAFDANLAILGLLLADLHRRAEHLRHVPRRKLRRRSLLLAPLDDDMTPPPHPMAPGTRPEDYDGVFKVNIACCPPDEQKLETLKKLPWARFHDDYLFVEPTDKARGIRRMMDHFGAPYEDVIVFGDAMNDLSMFVPEWTCVAMGNACEELKAKADYVTTESGTGVACARARITSRSPLALAAMRWSSGRRLRIWARRRAHCSASGAM